MTTAPSAAAGPNPVTPPVADDPASPWAQAEAALVAARITVTMIDSIDDARVVQDVVDRVWPQTDGSQLIDAPLLRALGVAGNYISFASDEAGLPVGACIGFFGPPAEAHLHSHIAGVVGSHAGRGIGRALKLHQRAWALDLGVTEIAWTFDPLVARNAYFNLCQLGATAGPYLPDFYGEMRDRVNRGFGSDRLLAVWELMDPRVVAACAPRTPGEPRPTPTAWVGPGRSTIAVPSDIEALRVSDPAAAVQWRVAVRDAFAAAEASGADVVGFSTTEGYLVEEKA